MFTKKSYTCKFPLGSPTFTPLDLTLCIIISVFPRKKSPSALKTTPLINYITTPFTTLH